MSAKIIFILLICVFRSYGHVSLTFPPARKYDLDFLDNGRTLPPCGMPKGNVRTSLLAGSSFNVTWHLAYPHQGGFRLQVLDDQEKHVLYLTPEDNFVSDDVTAQHFNVQLPQDFRCRDCTLRLVRKASEWGEGYQFFSCADVDILPRQEYREDCSGHGRILPGRPLICRCDRLYSGPRCQNKEECIDDRDCGSHGKCIEIESTTSPGKQCYCEAGWFGPGCASKSPIKNGRIDHDAYQKRKLHDDLTLYWRTIKDGEEIEFALIAKGTSYVALGWRPADLDESCRKFPEISGSTGSFEEPLKTTTITNIDNKSATNNATESPTDIKQTTEEMGIGDIADNFRSLGQSDQDGLGDDDVFVNSSESDKNNGSTYTKSGTISTITPLGDNTGEAPRSSSIKAETEPIIISSLPASTVSSSTLLVTVPSNTEKVLTSTSKTGSEKSSPAPSTATSLSLDKDSEEEAPSNSKNEKNSEEEEEDNYSPLEEVEFPKDSKSVTNGEDAVEEEEYEVTEYYDEYDASINSQVVPEEVNDIPGGLLSLTPHSTRIATFSPASFQNTPKMETDGWRPITRPTMAPLLNRLPVSEVVPVDTRPSTSEPESTRRLTGLDRLRQKLSSRAAAAATESTLGRRVSNLNSDELMAPDERQSFEQLFRKRRSTDLDRKLSGFAVPLDDASEEEVEYANNFDHSIHGPKNDFVAKEVEPKPEPNDSEHDHHDHHQEHGEKPLTNFTEDALPEPVPEPQPEPNLQSKGNSKPELGGDNADEVDWTPRGPLHPMDCTDIVIGMARGSLSRINDFYTRDRSTPRVDTYFGGRNDLTGAFAEEKEDMTTFIFRRKTNASEPTDHSILPGKMHVIWSKGQEPGQYKHVPKSGLEAGNSSVPDFYKPDELKYHGKENRGVVEIDFFAKADAVTEVIAQENGNISQSEDHNHGHNHSNHSHTEGHKHKTDAFCGGEFKYPNRCNPSGEDCLYYAKWEYREKTDDIAFTVRTNYTNKWVGIGFGQSSAMSETDAVIGWLDSNGRSAVVDTWILGYSHPRIDQLQDARDSKIQILDGKTTMTFTRKRETPDKDQDVQLGDGNCVYFKYPIHGGTFSAVSKRISKHTMTPVVSDNRICIKSCPGFGTSETSITYVKQPEIPQMIYDWSVKVKETAKGFQIPEPETEEFVNFARHVADNLTPALEKIPGFSDVVVKSISKDEDDIIAHLSLIIEETQSKGGVSMVDDSAVRQVIKDTVSGGQIGRLRVDPQFVKLVAIGSTSPVVEDRPAGFKTLGASTLYIVIGCLAALFFIFVVQAFVTICTTRKSRSLPSREQMITQSAWKDYSTTNSQQTNYAYESFGEDIKIASHSSRGSRDSLYQNGRVQERMPIARETRRRDIPTVASSLPRPRYDQPPPRMVHQKPSSTRLDQNGSSQFYPSQRNGTTSRKSDSQPDFYFMPSQRKYSGEIVRVYVDHNSRPM